jgi:hypothetical protein
MVMDEMIYLNKKFTEEELTELRKVMKEMPYSVVVPAEPIVKIVKLKKNIPTVIEYQGRRYTLSHDNQYRG